MNTTELILWSDIVISSATSILVESVQRKKLTICLEYLTPEKDNYAIFSDHEKIICIRILIKMLLKQLINSIRTNNLKLLIKKT